MSFNEIKQHGTEDFPFELYNVDKEHPKYKMAFHWHASVELIRVIDGRLSVTLDDRVFEATAGEILFVNSEVIHGATPTNCVYQCLVFNPAFLKTGNDGCNLFLDNLLSQNAHIPERIEDETLKSLVIKMMQEMDERKDGFAFKVIGLAAQFFGTVQEKQYLARQAYAGRDTQKIHKLKKVLKYIRDNFASEITLDDMARQAGLSTKYFCAFFKNMTGTTPVKYLLAYRVERAARKLLGTDESITRIAYDCGFNDLSYFIKTFKDVKRITPKNYRMK
ncbi:MAG: AraC family transcriptional regulator [Clostridia bacterium]|nr:AraC family transcriptional regulator [Clostridia bacterium]